MEWACVTTVTLNAETVEDSEEKLFYAQRRKAWEHII